MNRTPKQNTTNRVVRLVSEGGSWIVRLVEALRAT